MTNSIVKLAEDIAILNKNSIEAINSLSVIVSSTDKEIVIDQYDSNGQLTKISMPSIGSLKYEIDSIKQNIKSLSTIDKRGTIITPSKNDYKIVYVKELNKEPNIIPELSTITQFIADKNLFFDSLLNPMLKIRIDLNNKIADSTRKVLSRRYIINFENDEFGNYTTNGQNAIDLFNTNFKSRTNISISELESWILNTNGIDTDKQKNKIVYDEQEFDLEWNEIQYEGFFTILSISEDTLNKKFFFNIDTLNYYDLKTQQVKQLQINDELIINIEKSSTRYKIIEINNSTSEKQIRIEIVEGFDPVPVGIVGGLKYYSSILNNKNVDVSIGFNEYNVLFLKSIDTDNHIIGRSFSNGVAYYTNDLSLLSTENKGDNGKSMQQFYIETVKDFGDLLKDFVERQIPRSKGVKPNAPLLDINNFKVIQSNKFLTETKSLENQRKKHQQILDLRSKIDENNKIVQEKNRELIGKNFKSSKDKLDVENQIKKISEKIQSDTNLLSSNVNDLLASANNNITVTPSYELLGFFSMPNPVDNGQTRPQEAIAFYYEYKLSNIDGKESNNETFKVVQSDGTTVNAVFSAWKPLWSPLRRRVFDIATQSFVWEIQDLSSIDIPNINSIRLPINPNEQITLRVKTVSEVGYPDSILESDWSNELIVSFPTNLIEPISPQAIFQKNADLEDLRNRLMGDLNRKGLDLHLSDSAIFENKTYFHNTNNISSYDSNGKIISLTDKIKQLERSNPVESNIDCVLLSPWTNRGGNMSTAKYYYHEGRVYLQGNIQVDNGENITDINTRFPSVDINIYGKILNSNYSKLFYLPEGYRPSNIFRVPIICYSGNNTTGIDGKTGYVEINPNGLVQLSQGNSKWISLDNISFKI